MDRLAKFNELKARREKEHKLNFDEVKEEDRRSKIDPKAQAKRNREKQLAAELQKKEEAEEKGEDYQRTLNLTYTAEDVNNWEERQEKKNRASEKSHSGFTDFKTSSYNKYKRLIRNLEPNVERYETQKAQLGEEKIYKDADTIDFAELASQPRKEDVDRLVEDLSKQVSKRDALKKKRKVDGDEEDIDYINKRNQVFNKKIAKAFDKYTSEIRGNLERGTAL